MNRKIWIAIVIFVLLSGCAGTKYEDAKCVEGDCMNGHGLVQFKSGQTLSAQFKDGAINGEFERKFWHDGKIQATTRGKAINDMPHGLMVQELLNGSRYDYEYDNGALIRSKSKRVNGDIYDGEAKYVLNMPAFYGNGTYTTSTGAVFSGVFDTSVLKKSDGVTYVINIKGSAKYPDGVVSEGNFKSLPSNGNGAPYFFKRQGFHKVSLPTGEKYNGSFLDDLEDGKGTLISANGKKDSDQNWTKGNLISERPGPISLQYAKRNNCRINSPNTWIYMSDACQDGLAHGEGVAYSEDGMKTLSGTFVLGQLVQGTFDDGNGRKYIGEWQNFKLNGQAKYFQDGTLLYDGGYINNVRNGLGVCFDTGKPERCEHYAGERVDTLYMAKLWKDQSVTIEAKHAKNVEKAKEKIKDSRSNWEREFENTVKNLERQKENDQNMNVAVNFLQALNVKTSGGSQDQARVYAERAARQNAEIERKKIAEEERHASERPRKESEWARKLEQDISGSKKVFDSEYSKLSSKFSSSCNRIPGKRWDDYKHLCVDR